MQPRRLSDLAAARADALRTAQEGIRFLDMNWVDDLEQMISKVGRGSLPSTRRNLSLITQVAIVTKAR